MRLAVLAFAIGTLAMTPFYEEGAKQIVGLCLGIAALVVSFVMYGMEWRRRRSKRATGRQGW